ncbi:MAG: calcium/sodium antiporter [Pseudomonadota bacterium]
MAYLLLVVGFVALVFGGEMMVRGAVGMATKLNIPQIVVGLTVVAFGTSAPELFVSLDAALSGAAGIAVGNVVGSNVANVLAVLGLPALIIASTTPSKGLGLNLAVMVGLSLLLLAAMATGEIGRGWALVFLACLVGFLWLQYRETMAARARGKTGGVDEELEEVSEDVPSKGWAIAGLLLAGLVGLQVGANLIVDSSIEIAQAWGVSDAVIGVTIVAIGTSLPEMAASLASALKGRSALALGNIVGSNIFNIAAILGVTAMVVPIPVDPHLMRFDVWVMLAAAALLCGLYFSKIKVGRGLGVAFIAGYVAYLAATLYLG